jgi:hypothetical protein
LLRLFRRRPEFELISSKAACRSSIFVSRSSTLENRSSGLTGGSSESDRHSSELKSHCSGSGKDSSVLKLCSSELGTVPPVLKGAPPKFSPFLRFQKLLLRFLKNRAGFASCCQMAIYAGAGVGRFVISTHSANQSLVTPALATF